MDFFPVKLDFPDIDTGYVVSGNPNIDLLLICRTIDGGLTWVIDSLVNSSWVRNIDFYNGKKGLISFGKAVWLTINLLYFSKKNYHFCTGPVRPDAPGISGQWTNLVNDY